MQIMIKHARILADKTQAGMARELGIDRGTYGKWEANPDKIPIAGALRIAQILGRSIDELFFAQNSTNSRIPR